MQTVITLDYLTSYMALRRDTLYPRLLLWHIQQHAEMSQYFVFQVAHKCNMDCQKLSSNCHKGKETFKSGCQKRKIANEKERKKTQRGCCQNMSNDGFFRVLAMFFYN